MIVSLIIYLVYSKLLPNKEKASKETEVKVNKVPLTALFSLLAAGAVGAAVYFASGNIDIAFAFGLFGAFVAWILQISTKEERPAIMALLMVFVVVIFFWMSFHQNGLTLTFFARDYTVKTVALSPICSLHLKISFRL